MLSFFAEEKMSLMAKHLNSLIQFLLHDISIHNFSHFLSFSSLHTETSMDQDMYGTYTKQRIESLTTDGEGES